MKLFKHLNVVIKHKWLVFIYGIRMHIPVIAFFHDLSKFHPVEFFRSVKYFAGDKSPTIIERQYNNSVSYITLHHTLRNKHHWHCYVDFLPKNIVIARINYKHSVEYVCDILAASKVYLKKDYTPKSAYEYFSEHSKTYLMHPANKEFVIWCTDEISKYGFKKMKKRYLIDNYNRIINKYPVSILIPFDNFSLDYLNIIES